MGRKRARPQKTCRAQKHARAARRQKRGKTIEYPSGGRQDPGEKNAKCRRRQIGGPSRTCQKPGAVTDKTIEWPRGARQACAGHRCQIIQCPGEGAIKPSAHRQNR